MDKEHRTLKEILNQAGGRLLSWYEETYPQYDFLGICDPTFGGTDRTRYLILTKEKKLLGRTELTSVARVRKDWAPEDIFKGLISIDFTDPNLDHTQTPIAIMEQANHELRESIDKTMREAGFTATFAFHLQNFGKYKAAYRHSIFNKEIDEKNYPRNYSIMYEGEQYVVYSPGSSPNQDLVLGRLKKEVSTGSLIKKAILELFRKEKLSLEKPVELGYLAGPGKKGNKWAYIENIPANLEKEIREYVTDMKKKEVHIPLLSEEK